MQTKELIDRLEREVERFEELEHHLADPAVSSDPALLKQYSREHTVMQPRVQAIRGYLKLLSDIAEAREIVASEKDAELLEMAREELCANEAELETRRSEIEMLLIPPDPNSGKSVLLEIRAGTGGEEAGLFVGDLMRMYARFCEKQGLHCETIYAQETGIGGFKEVVLGISGPAAYDLLHREGGGHRVQRIPVTESGGRIHTSAVTVAVIPEAEESEIEINDKDLEIDTYRASGAGGQHVNKTDSAIRITHIPTGLVVTCQDERSQLKNKTKAMRILRSRLAEQEAARQHAEASAKKKEQVGSGDRSERIRTYNFPQGRVTDHQIGYTAYNLAGFMEGEALELFESLLQNEREEKIKELA
ncbi:MAG: peptide chain release factor 1 [Leptospiraceae bacterium]|nr:peptide chain release factor 1 [Leptospiraceae bacterium]